jgi:hypothetical protein
MKKLFTLVAIALSVMSANAQTESYTAVDQTGLATEFSSIIDVNGVATNESDGKSFVTTATTNVDMLAVGGALPATITGSAAQDINADGTVNSWASITWASKNQSDINFYYIAGAGVPYVALSAAEITTDGVGTGTYKAAYTTYLPDGTNGMPITGLYYKLTAKVAGSMKVGVWINKGNRNTYVVEESSKLPVAYSAEGYINGQNENGVKKYLSSAQVDSIHKAAKVDATTGVDSAPYIIGAGNQPFWGYLIFTAEAGKSYWIFIDNAQIGFQGFTFTPSTTGINETVNDNEVKNVPLYNMAGQRVDSSYKGIIIEKGKKYLNR